MACPAGYGGDGKKMTSNIQVDKFEKPHIYPTIAEPDELKSIMNEAIYLLGGQFAILCQFAHPGLALGTHYHSTFSSRLLHRLRTTSRFLNAAISGTTEEKQAIFSIIHAKHATVRGPNYSADDPALHKWTAATLFVSIIIVHEAFFGKVDRPRMEKMYMEAAVWGTSLRMDGSMWPESLDAFWEYWHATIAEINVTDEARGLARSLLWPEGGPVWFRALAPTARLLTIQWLPQRLQKEYGFLPKITPMRNALYHSTVAYIALVYPHLPKKVRGWPSKVYMRDLKKAVKRIEETGGWGDDSEAKY